MTTTNYYNNIAAKEEYKVVWNECRTLNDRTAILNKLQAVKKDSSLSSDEISLYKRILYSKLK